MRFGKIKVKSNSSAGGHNGIKDIIAVFKSNEFARLKIGIDRSKDVMDWVLSKFDKK